MISLKWSFPHRYIRSVIDFPSFCLKLKYPSRKHEKSPNFFEIYSTSIMRLFRYPLIPLLPRCPLSSAPGCYLLFFFRLVSSASGIVSSATSFPEHLQPLSLGAYLQQSILYRISTFFLFNTSKSCNHDDNYNNDSSDHCRIDTFLT